LRSAAIKITLNHAQIPSRSGLTIRDPEPPNNCPKLSLAVHAASHLIVAARATIGMGPDHAHFIPLLARACCRMNLGVVLADAGFDSEANHRYGTRDSEDSFGNPSPGWTAGNA
jgi:hypothetical protein